MRLRHGNYVGIANFVKTQPARGLSFIFRIANIALHPLADEVRAIRLVHNVRDSYVRHHSAHASTMGEGKLSTRFMYFQDINCICVDSQKMAPCE